MTSRTNSGRCAGRRGAAGARQTISSRFLFSGHFRLSSDKGNGTAKVSRLSRLLASVERHRPFPDSLEGQSIQNGLAQGFGVGVGG